MGEGSHPVGQNMSKFPSSFLFSLIHVLVYIKTQGSQLRMANVIEMRIQSSLGFHILLVPLSPSCRRELFEICAEKLLSLPAP